MGDSTLYNILYRHIFVCANDLTLVTGTKIQLSIGLFSNFIIQDIFQ